MARRPVGFVVPGSIDGRTGGYEYDRRLVDGLRSRGRHVDVHEVAGAFPRPDSAARDEVRRRFSAIDEGAIAMVDGLLFGSIPDEAAEQRDRLSFAAIVHLPLAQHAGLTSPEAAAFEASERRALAAASIVIATGSQTCATLATVYAVPRERIVLAEPGTDRSAPARGSRDEACVHIVCVAALTSGKGQEMLVSALARVPHHMWRLTLVGSTDKDVEYAARVRAAVDAHDLSPQVTFAGELSRRDLDRAYDAADLFALATLHETYGMAAAEAIARGLPVVGTAAGAMPQIVGDGGRLVAPGDVDALAAALLDVIVDPAARSGLRRGALEAARRLPSWDSTVDRIAAALDRIER